MLIIDVGANHGEFTLEVAKRNKAYQVVAIEPIKALRNIIKKNAAVNSLDNIMVLACAIDQEERYAQLNVSSHSDWGVSSLLDFDKGKLENEYWKTRSDMYFDSHEKVHVRTLFSVLEELNVSESNRVKFIKIDAQGLDLQVLLSAGEYIDCIDAGMLEISVNVELGLYEGEKYNLKSVLDFLQKNDFEAYYIKPNDPASNEFNVYFNRIGLQHQKIEEELSLKGIDIYDGKFYWHFPSPNLLNIEYDYHILKQAYESKGIELESKSIEYEKISLELNNILDNQKWINEQSNNLIPWVTDVNQLLMWLEKSRIIKLLRYMFKLR